MRILFKSRSFVGVDINHDEIRILHLKKSSKGYTVENFAIKALPPETLQDGRIKQFDKVQEILRHVIIEMNLVGSPAAISLPANCVIHKRIKLASCLREIEREAEIYHNLSHFFPGVTDILDFDFITVKEMDDEYHEVMVVAGRSEQIKAYRALIQNAGLDLKVIDVDSYAIARGALHVVDADPFYHMSFSVRVNKAELKTVASRLLVCCGLATRSFS